MQKDIDANMELIEAQQNELSQMLDVYEKNISDILAGAGDGKMPLRMTSADQDREKAFKVAETLDHQMEEMSTQLKSIIELVNKTRTENAEEGIAADEETPMAQIISILNNHLVAINSIDEETKQLNELVEQVEKMGLDVQKDVDRVHRRDPRFTSYMR